MTKVRPGRTPTRRPATTPSSRMAQRPASKDAKASRTPERVSMVSSSWGEGSRLIETAAASAESVGSRSVDAEHPVEEDGHGVEDADAGGQRDVDDLHE